MIHECHSLRQKCISNKSHQKLFRIAFLYYINGPRSENLEITRIKIIAIVDAKVYTVALFFCIRIAILSPSLEYISADLRLKYTYDYS